MEMVWYIREFPHTSSPTIHYLVVPLEALSVLYSCPYYLNRSPFSKSDSEFEPQS